jgi:hypothetical protein
MSVSAYKRCYQRTFSEVQLCTLCDQHPTQRSRSTMDRKVNGALANPDSRHSTMRGIGTGQKDECPVLFRPDPRSRRSIELRQLTGKERVLGKLRGEFVELSAGYFRLLFAEGRQRQHNLCKRPQVVAMLGMPASSLATHAAELLPGALSSAVQFASTP